MPAKLANAGIAIVTAGSTLNGARRAIDGKARDLQGSRAERLAQIT
jgi:hypothetical protein